MSACGVRAPRFTRYLHGPPTCEERRRRHMYDVSVVNGGDEIERVQARGHHVAPAMSHGADPGGVVHELHDDAAKNGAVAGAVGGKHQLHQLRRARADGVGRGLLEQGVDGVGVGEHRR